jgi:hypothetical protein
VNLVVLVSFLAVIVFTLALCEELVDIDCQASIERSIRILDERRERRSFISLSFIPSRIPVVRCWYLSICVLACFQLCCGI